MDAHFQDIYIYYKWCRLRGFIIISLLDILESENSESAQTPGEG